MEDLHFENSGELFGFAKELQTKFPPRCTDALGNICIRVQSETVDIAESVDLKEISEAEAIEKANTVAAEYARSCKYGLSLSSSKKCGKGIGCIVSGRR